MSYQQNQGYPPYGAPPQGYPTQPPPGQFGAPPPGQYGTPQGGYGAPPAGQYGAPPPGQYGAPPSGQYGAPPSGQYGAPPSQYGAPPPGGQSAPVAQYGAPPLGQYGAPPAQYGAPPGQYGAPPAQYGAPNQYATQYSGAPSLPSPGYGPLTMPLNDASAPADTLRKAMKGFGTDDAALIRTLCHYPGPLIPHLKTTYQQRHSRSLENDIKSETSGHFESSLLAILRGPLDEDVHLLNKALKGAGTEEELLNDVLIARSNADLNAIKKRYHEIHHRTLESDVASDLSAKTGRLFSMILAATRQEESSPIVGQNVEQDASEIQRATEGQFGADQLTVCSILANRSNNQIRAIAQAYHARFRLPLEDVIKKEFSGHMETALLQMVRAATDPVMRDAILLEDCMAGPGTKDDRLIARVVRIHWDRGHAGQVARAYRQKFGQDLVKRIEGETSGSYEKILVAMVG